MSLRFDEGSNGLILVEAHLDHGWHHGKDEPFVIDLGSELNLLVDRQSADRAGLRKQESKFPLEANIDAPHPVELTTWRTGVLRSEKVTLARGAFPEADFSRTLREPIAGIVGVPIVSRYVLGINYDEHRLNFYKPDKFVPPPDSQEVALLPNPANKLLLIQAQVSMADGSAPKLTFYLDSGFDEDLSINPTYYRQHPEFGGELPLPRRTLSTARSWKDPLFASGGSRLERSLPARTLRLSSPTWQSRRQESRTGRSGRASCTSSTCGSTPFTGSCIFPRGVG